MFKWKKNANLIILACLFFLWSGSAIGGDFLNDQSLDETGAVLRSEAGKSGPFVRDFSSPPWNLISLVSDGTSWQSIAPDLKMAEDGVLHSAFQGSSLDNDNIFLRLLYANSSDDNETWTDPNLQPALSSDFDLLLHPDFVCTDDQRVWLTFTQGRPDSPGYGIKFVRSDDGGQTFNAPVDVDDGSPSDKRDFWPNAIAQGDTVCVAWYEWDSALVNFNRSFDGGLTWLPSDIVINNTNQNQEHSRTVLAMDEKINRLYILWANRDGRVVIVHSDDYGDRWSEPRRVSDDGAHACIYPSLCIDSDGVLYALWTDFRSGTDLDIRFSKSTDEGNTWTNIAIKVSDEVLWGNQYESHLALGTDGVLHAAFIHNIPGQLNINAFYSRSIDGGLTWEANTRVNDVANSVGAWVPRSLEVEAGPAGSAFVAWRDMRNEPHISSEIMCASNLSFSPVGDPVGKPNLVNIQIFPNPTANRVEFNAPGPNTSPYSIEIYTLAGHRIAGKSSIGDGGWMWDLCNESGRRVSAGMYLARYVGSRGISTRSFVVVH